jgi:hypothetical protein
LFKKKSREREGVKESERARENEEDVAEGKGH